MSEEKTSADRLREIVAKLDDTEENWVDLSATDSAIGIHEDVWDTIKRLVCEVSGEHCFCLDQCGYWQHQFCSFCGQPKYPDLVGIRCGDLTERPEPMCYVHSNRVIMLTDLDRWRKTPGDRGITIARTARALRERLAGEK